MEKWFENTQDRQVSSDTQDSLFTKLSEVILTYLSKSVVLVFILAFWALGPEPTFIPFPFYLFGATDLRLFGLPNVFGILVTQYEAE